MHLAKIVLHGEVILSQPEAPSCQISGLRSKRHLPPKCVVVGLKDEPRTLDVRSQLCDALHYRVTFPLRREVIPQSGFEQMTPVANGLSDVFILLLR